MVTEAIQDTYDVVYLLSCDADYIPAVKFVRGLGKKVFLAVPKGAKYGRLRKECDVAIPITQDTVNTCQA